MKTCIKIGVGLAVIVESYRYTVAFFTAINKRIASALDKYANDVQSESTNN